MTTASTQQSKTHSMIQSQRKVVDTCAKVTQKAQEGGVSETITNDLETLTGVAQNCELVVPVIGAFSSGKSSLINSLIGDSILPVAITPETSLATELHYAIGDNYVEAVKENGEVDRYAITDFKKMSDNAAQYTYARAYLDNPRLKEIEPLVLVDMPGFDSPLDAHNKAIMTYLERGCYYIVLSSVEEGTISKSLERRLREIDGWGRDFSFFLTKADLRPKETIAQIAEYCRSQLADNFDKEVPVESVESKSTEAVMNCVKSIDVNRIFLSLFREQLLGLCQEIISTINLQVNATRKDKAAIESAVKEMEASIEKLRQQAESETDAMRLRYSGTLTDDVLKDISSELDGAIDELVSVAVSGNEAETGRRINEVIRSAFTVSLKGKLENINQQIVGDFSSSLQGLDKIMKDLKIDDAYIQNLTKKIQVALVNLQTLIKTVSVGTKAAGIATAAGGAAAAGGAVAAGGAAAGLVAIAPIALPIIGIALLFLPDLLEPVFRERGEQKLQKAIRTKLAGEVFPALKRKLRDEIPSYIEPQIADMINQVHAQYEAQLKDQSEVINKQVAEKTANAAEVEAKRQKLEAVRDEVQGITNEIMEWKK